MSQSSSRPFRTRDEALRLKEAHPLRFELRYDNEKWPGPIPLLHGGFWPSLEAWHQIEIMRNISQQEQDEPRQSIRFHKAFFALVRIFVGSAEAVHLSLSRAKYLMTRPEAHVEFNGVFGDASYISRNHQTEIRVVESLRKWLYCESMCKFVDQLPLVIRQAFETDRNSIVGGSIKPSGIGVGWERVLKDHSDDVMLPDDLERLFAHLRENTAIYMQRLLEKAAQRPCESCHVLHEQIQGQMKLLKKAKDLHAVARHFNTICHCVQESTRHSKTCPGIVIPDIQAMLMYDKFGMTIQHQSHRALQVSFGPDSVPQLHSKSHVIFHNNLHSAFHPETTRQGSFRMRSMGHAAPKKTSAESKLERYLE